MILITFLINLSLSSICIEDSNFETIEANVAEYFKVGPENEICLQYKLYDIKTERKAIVIYIPQKNGDDLITEVLIYELKSDIY